jgi:hypothetical protein
MYKPLYQEISYNFVNDINLVNDKVILEMLLHENTLNKLMLFDQIIL